MVRRLTKGTGESPAQLNIENAIDKVKAEDLQAGANRSTFASAALLSYCERFERLAEEAQGLREDMKEIMAEAKGQGFDTKTLRVAIRRRAMDTAKRQEQDSMLELYEEALRAAEKAAFTQSVAEAE